MFVNYLAQRVSVAPFEVALHALPCHGLSLADLLGGYSFGDVVSSLDVFTITVDGSKVKPHVSFFIVLDYAFAVFVHQTQVELPIR
jgi:hypothetical protein